MPKMNDQQYLLANQYRDATNLNARMELHRRFSTNPYGWGRWLFDQFELPPVCRMLDVGCGPASLWTANMKRVPAGWDIILSDFSRGMVDQAKQNLSGTSHPFAFECFDAQTIPFPDAHFDAVLANHMLYHVPDRDKAISEFRRVLRPGGKLIASTIGQNHTREWSDLIARFSTANSCDATPASVKEFTLENGAEQLRRHFSQVSMRRYEDALMVTEVEPLVNYIISMIRFADADLATQREALTRFVERELAAQGTIHITKDSGVFLAR